MTPFHLVEEAKETAVDAFSVELLVLVNAARAESRMCGEQFMPAVPPVTWDAQLALAAQGHSDDMAENDYFSHTGLDGDNVGDRVSETGYVWRTVGENLYGGIETAEGAIAGWLESPGHCLNIMRESYTEMGVAYTRNPAARYRIYWTQVFGAPR
jgi:uncharacterized protein YkwD